MGFRGRIQEKVGFSWYGFKHAFPVTAFQINEWIHKDEELHKVQNLLAPFSLGRQDGGRASEDTGHTGDIATRQEAPGSQVAGCTSRAWSSLLTWLLVFFAVKHLTSIKNVTYIKNLKWKLDEPDRRVSLLELQAEKGPSHNLNTNLNLKYLWNGKWQHKSNLKDKLIRIQFGKIFF